MSRRIFRIFVSSPSDVMPERERVTRVWEKLTAEVAGRVEFEAVRWEESFYTATETFQRQIPKPSETDLVICILWKRLGSELPPDLYRRADGTVYASGTEYEFEEAREAVLMSGTPDILAYRKTAKVQFDADQVALQQAQFQALESFWQRWFRSEAGHFVAGFQTFADVEEFGALFERHLRAWLARQEQAQWGAHRGTPFRGLKPFDEAHSDVFFGRRRVIEQLRARAVAALLKGCGFILILGASGTGKSSVIRAGLLPRLQRAASVPGIDLWRRVVFRPSELGADPLLGFCGLLYDPGAGVLPELGAGDYAAPEDLAALARGDPGRLLPPLQAALRRIAQAAQLRLGQSSAPSVGLIVAVDQLEELFALPEEDRRALGGLFEALSRSGFAVVVATMRSDFYALLSQDDGLRRLKDEGATFDLPPPAPADIREIIQGPAHLAGLSFETNVETQQSIDALLERAAQAPGALPLLQFTLDELYHRRDRASGRITAEAYRSLGGIEGAIQSTAQAVFDRLSPAAQATLGPVLLQLVNDSHEDVAPTLRSTPRTQVANGADSAQLVDGFVEARLLVASDAGGSATLRLAHEALITGWAVARELIEADREIYRTRARLEAHADIWQQQGRDDDYLLAPGRPLAEAVELWRSNPAALTAAVTAFVERSVAAEESRQAKLRQEIEARARAEETAQRQAAEREAQSARLVARRTRLAAVLLAGLLMLAVGAGLYADQQRREAVAQRERAEQNFETALETGRGLVTDVANVFKNVTGVPIDLIDQVLAASEALYDKLLGSAVDDPRLIYQRAQMQLSMAEAKRALGDSTDALYRAGDARDLILGLIARKEGSAEAQIDLANAHSLIGDLLRERNKPRDAQAAYAESMTIRRRLVEAEPDNIDRQRDLAISHHNNGDVLFDLGEQDKALVAYRASEALVGRLLKQKPYDSYLRSDLAHSYERIGDILRAQGGKFEAFYVFTEAHAIRKDLAAEDETSASAQRDLGFSHMRLGDAFKDQGNGPGALQDYRAAKAIRERLAKLDPWNVGLKRDLAETHEALGETLFEQGDVDGALEALSEGIDARESGASVNQDNVAWWRDLAHSYGRRGDIQEGRGDRAGALASYKAEQEVRITMVELEPEDSDMQRDLGASYWHVGKLLLETQTYPEAEKALLKGLAIQEKLVERMPDDGERQRDLYLTLDSLGQVMMKSGRKREALERFERARVIANALLLNGAPLALDDLKWITDQIEKAGGKR